MLILLRLIILLLSSLIVMLWSPGLLAKKTVINFVSWGGSYQNSQIQAMQKPYTKKTGVTFNNLNYSGGLAKLYAQVEYKQYSWDIIDVIPSDMLRAKEEGLLAPINILPFPDGMLKTNNHNILAINDFEGLAQVKQSNNIYYAIPNISWSTYIAFDKTKYPATKYQPHSMKDFFDLKHFPGKRGLWKNSPQSTLEMALYADGVPKNKIYTVLATAKGQDRAFKKLASLKGHILWWTTGAQPPQLLADHEVVMTEGWNGRISAAILNDKMPFGEIWDGAVFDLEYFIIPKGSPKYQQVLTFLQFATSTYPLANTTKYIPYGPLRKSSQSWVSQDIKPYLPTTYKKQAIFMNSHFWLNYKDSIQKRWENFIAHS